MIEVVAAFEAIALAGEWDGACARFPLSNGFVPSDSKHKGGIGSKKFPGRREFVHPRCP